MILLFNSDRHSFNFSLCLVISYNAQCMYSLSVMFMKFFFIFLDEEVCEKLLTAVKKEVMIFFG